MFCLPCRAFSFSALFAISLFCAPANSQELNLVLLMRHFETLIAPTALDYLPKISRWEEPVKANVYALSDTALITRQRVEAAFAAWGQQTGLSISFVKPGETIVPNTVKFQLVIGSADVWDRFENEYFFVEAGESKAEKQSRARLVAGRGRRNSQENHMGCETQGYFKPDGPLVYVYGVISERGIPSKDCFHSVYWAVSGLAALPTSGAPSVFDGSKRYETFTAYDLAVIRLLYSPPVYPGMSKVEAVRSVRQVLGLSYHR